MKQKTRIFIYILIAIAVVIMGSIAILKNHRADVTTTVTAQEHIDLGRIYLVDLSYEKAVLEFTEAIEIEPLNVDAYLGLAETYVGMGDTEKAVDVLEEGYDKTGDERLKSMLEGLLPFEAVTLTEKTNIIATVSTVEENSENLIDLEETVELYIPCNINCISELDYPESALGNEYFKKYGKYELKLTVNQGYVYANIMTGNLFKDSKVIQINNSKNIYKILQSECPGCGVFCKIAEPAVNVYDINGNVIQTGKNIYDENENLIEAISYDSGGSVLMSKKYEYDVNENLIKETSESGYEIYNYNSDGKILSKIKYNNDGIETSHSTCTYDANGNISTYQNSDIIRTYECDLNGNILKCHYISDGDGIYYVLYDISEEYNSKGNVIKREDYSVMEAYSDVVGVTTYSYDSFDRLVKSQYNGNNVITTAEERTIVKENSVSEFIYNDNNDLIKVIDNETLFGDRTYEYKYDSQHRLIEKGDDNGVNCKYYYNDRGLIYKIDSYGFLQEYTYVKIELPKVFANQIKEKYGIDLSE
ncbi:MAG: tetratricopeptide repeat protein [Eubacterium sp.]|nr:tetratricopeptide repeat protein [Eubacterium sp.]